MKWGTFKLSSFWGVLFLECVAVNITRLKVPALVEMGTDSVILDCAYNASKLGVQDGLVVKWFFNSSAGLVHQWIPPMRPQVIGLLKGKVELNFRISDEPLQAYRAIKILRPTTDLSGNYTCVVSTFMEEDRQTRPMLVYNLSGNYTCVVSTFMEEDRQTRPMLVYNLSGNYTCVVSTFMEEDRQTRPMLVYSRGKSFHFIQEKLYVFLVTLICFAEDLYPKPVMRILSQGTPLKQAVTQITMDSWGLYTVETKAVVHDDDVTNPEEFVCELSVPAANYTDNRTTVYYPGLMPTAHIAAIEVEKPQEHQAAGGARSQIHTNVLYFILAFIL